MAYEQFLKPRYDGCSFTLLPKIIGPLLYGAGSEAFAAIHNGRLPEQYKHIVLFLLDGFGWRFVERYIESDPFLSELDQRGVIAEFSSQFPSTTAAHVTCLHSGLETGQSGVFEWQYYEPTLDAVISPLLFSFAGTKVRDTLIGSGADPAVLYPRTTLYESLAVQGIESHVHQHRDLARSTCSEVMCRGASIHPFISLPQAIASLFSLLERETRPSYHVIYHGDVDSVMHQFGPNSNEVHAEIDTLLTVLDRLLLRQAKHRCQDTLFVFTADHGAIETDPSTTIYLNRDSEFAGLDRLLRCDRSGKLLPPGGSSRDPFLYIKEGMVDDATWFLTRRLEDRAWVRRVDDLADEGYFGALPVTEQFRSRAGDLIVLPYDKGTVWWYEQGRFEHTFYGHHGGLTSEEMKIPVMLLAT